MLTYVDTNRIHPLKSYQIAYAMVCDGSSTRPRITYPICVQIRLSINFIKLPGLTVSTRKIIANSCEWDEDIYTRGRRTYGHCKFNKTNETDTLYLCTQDTTQNTQHDALLKTASVCRTVCDCAQFVIW